MRNLRLLVSMFVLLGGWVEAAASTTTIDFEDLPADPFYTYTKDRATFTAVDGSLLQRFADTPNGTYSLTALVAPYAELRADIDEGTPFVSVDLGDFAGIDAETVFLEGFDASGTSVGFTSQDIPEDLMGMTTLCLYAPCISYVIFGSRNSTIGNGSSVPADNFTYCNCPCSPTIPAPAALLAAVGAGLFGCMRRRIR